MFQALLRSLIANPHPFNIIMPQQKLPKTHSLPCNQKISHSISITSYKQPIHPPSIRHKTIAQIEQSSIELPKVERRVRVPKTNTKELFSFIKKQYIVLKHRDKITAIKDVGMGREENKAFFQDIKLRGRKIKTQLADYDEYDRQQQAEQYQRYIKKSKETSRKTKIQNILKRRGVSLNKPQVRLSIFDQLLQKINSQSRIIISKEHKIKSMFQNNKQVLNEKSQILRYTSSKFRRRTSAQHKHQ